MKYESVFRFLESNCTTDANMTMGELKDMVNSMSANQMVNRLQRYVSKVQGRNQKWYQRLQELLGGCVESTKIMAKQVIL